MTDALDDPTLWPRVRALLGAAGPVVFRSVERFVGETGLDPITHYVLGLVLANEPAPMPAATVEGLGPYSASGHFGDQFAAATRLGLLREQAPLAYRLTDAGRAHLLDSYRQLESLLAGTGVTPTDAERVAEILGRLAEASVTTPPPPDPNFSSLFYRLVASGGAPLLVALRAVACLDAYRSDAHQGAWRPTGLSPVALEVMTLLWKGEATSLKELCERLDGPGYRRGHPAATYATALGELRSRELADGTDDTLSLTTNGCGFRQAVEDDTDRYFFAPWHCLDELNRAELDSLLTLVTQRLAA